MKTCVLPFSRRNGFEWTMRSRSRWNGVRTLDSSSGRSRPFVSSERTASGDRLSSSSRIRCSNAACVQAGDLHSGQRSRAEVWKRSRSEQAGEGEPGRREAARGERRAADRRPTNEPNCSAAVRRPVTPSRSAGARSSPRALPASVRPPARNASAPKSAKLTHAFGRTAPSAAVTDAAAQVRA